MQLGRMLKGSVLNNGPHLLVRIIEEEGPDTSGKICIALAGSGRECEEVANHLEQCNGARMPVKGEAAEYTLEVVKHAKDNKDALIMPNGQDLIAMCCKAYETPDGVGSSVGDKDAKQDSEQDTDDPEGYDYSGFRVVALRKGSMIISVATLRLFGTQLAEMPFVATRQGHRRAGHCRRLMKGVEDMLRQLRVCWLVIPSIRSVLPMWRYKLNFIPLTLEEQAALEPHIVSPDFESAQLVKKRMWPPINRRQPGHRPAAAAAAVLSSGTGRGRGRRGPPGRSTSTRGRNSAVAGTEGSGVLTLNLKRPRKKQARAAVVAAGSDADESSECGDGDEPQAQGAGVGQTGRPCKRVAAKKLRPPAKRSCKERKANRGDKDWDATEEEKAAALAALRADVEKAGGALSAAWSVALSCRQPNGTFRSKAFIEPVTGKVFRSVMAVKRFLQLDLPPGASVTAPDAIRSFYAAAVEEMLRQGGANVQTLVDK
eukprot:gene9984-10139_t